MSYDKYALIHAQQLRERQMADAADHRLARLSRIRAARRSRLRPVGQALVRLGHALGAEPEAALVKSDRSR
jgi:hypothetical protein